MRYRLSNECEVRLRRANDGDVPHIARLAGVGHGVWTAAQFAAELTLQWSRTDVVETVVSEKLVACMVYWRVADETQLLNIVVDEEHRRRGLGEYLLTMLRERAAYDGHRRITLEVGRDNSAARRLYERMGFVVVGMRANYYAATDDDAILMEQEF